MAEFDDKTDRKLTPFFVPGDVIMIQPKNDEGEVIKLIKRYNLDADQILKITID